MKMYSTGKIVILTPASILYSLNLNYIQLQSRNGMHNLHKQYLVSIQQFESGEVYVKKFPHQAEGLNQLLLA